MALPDCELKVDGDAKLLAPVLVAVQWAESMDLLDALEAELQVSVGDPHVGKVLAKCQPGKKFALTFGDRTVEGDLTRVEIAYDSSGLLVITLFGLETIHRLRHVQVGEVSDQAVDKVVEALIKKSSATAAVQGVLALERELVLHDASALRLLKRLASERDYVLRADKGRVAFAPRGDKGADVKLDFFREVERVQMVSDLDDVPTSVKVQGMDYVTDKAAEYKAEEAKLAKISGGDTAVKIRKAAWGALDLVLPMDMNVRVNTEAQDLAIGTLRARAEHFVQGRVHADFAPAVVAGGQLTLDGAPWPLAGPFRVRALEHWFGPGVKSGSRVDFFSDSLPRAGG